MTDIIKMTEKITKGEVRDFYQQLQKKMSEEELAGIELKKFIIRKIMQKYKIKNEGNFLKGEFVYDYQTALKENNFISYFFRGKKAKKELANMLWDLEKQIEKGYIPILDPKNHPKGYVRAKEFFGNIKGKRGHNNLCNEIDDIIMRKENPKDHSRRLQYDYHKKKTMIEGDKKNKFEGYLDYVKKRYEGWTEEDIEHLREWNKLSKSQQPLKRKKVKKRPKPLDELNISHVSAAMEMEIINYKENLVLKYRYFLNEDGGINSLKLVADWLVIDPLIVRYLEIRAIKKMKSHIKEIIKRVEAEIPEGKDLTEEEHRNWVLSQKEKSKRRNY